MKGEGKGTAVAVDFINQSMGFLADENQENQISQKQHGNNNQRKAMTLFKRVYTLLFSLIHN